MDKWIDAKERLPEVSWHKAEYVEGWYQSEYVLIQVSDEIAKKYDINKIVVGYMIFEDGDLDDPDHLYGHCWHIFTEDGMTLVGEEADGKSGDIVAWMPLPEPYERK